MDSEENNMQYIKSKDYKSGARDLATEIVAELKDGRKVLWFLTGGSSISSCVEAFNIVRNELVDLSNLTVTLTDERYGEVGHVDSSWQKLIDSGFDFDLVPNIPVLKGLRFTETARDWQEALTEVFSSSDLIIAQFGIGSDLHIAGILPESLATKEIDFVSFYSTDEFNRITLSFEGIKQINRAYVFIFGESKKDVISELQDSDEPISQKPANILKSLPEVFVYSDQI